MSFKKWSSKAENEELGFTSSSSLTLRKIKISFPGDNLIAIIFGMPFACYRIGFVTAFQKLVFET